VQEVKKTSMNKKKLKLREQSADIYKNGRLFDEYSLFGLAWKPYRFGLPENLASDFLPVNLAIFCSKESQGTLQ
jgi:hypothetical protein